MATVIDIGDALQHGAATLRLPRPAAWEFFHQGHQCCVRAPRFDDLRQISMTFI